MRDEQHTPENPQEGYDARGLIEQYARWRRKAALLIWGALGFLLLVTIVFVALGWIR